MTEVVIAVVLTALVFDFTNGFHDTANAIATSVATRALSPGIAIVMSALANFGGALVGTEDAAAYAVVEREPLPPEVPNRTVLVPEENQEYPANESKPSCRIRECSRESWIGRRKS